MFVNIGTPARAFRDACRAKGVMVARDFPPFEKTHARISLGTMEEMTKAVQVFGEVLAKKIDGRGVGYEVTKFERQNLRIAERRSQRWTGVLFVRRQQMVKTLKAAARARRRPRRRRRLDDRPDVGPGRPAMPSTKNGDWPHYTADVRGTQVLAARSDQRRQLQQARSRVALQDRQPRHASRVQARRHAAGGQGRALHDRRHAPLGRRARRPRPAS